LGHRFGLIGSTDHHSAHPGSHGHGRVAAWASELTRDGIWKAFLARRVYAPIGPAGEGDSRWGAGECRDGLLQFTANRALPRLNLCAEEVRTIVGDQQPQAPRAGVWPLWVVCRQQCGQRPSFVAEELTTHDLCLR